jgi:hypothetical protein
MFPLLETRNSRAIRPAAAAATAGADRPRRARETPAPRARLRRAADLLLAFATLDALRLPPAPAHAVEHPHRRAARVDLPGRRAGMPPRPDQLCVTPRLQAPRLRGRSTSR